MTSDLLRDALPGRPSKLERTLSELPAEPGVYIMRDAAGKPLYVGKAKSLRARVRSYFNRSGDTRHNVPFLVERVDDIEVFLTGNEKEALILENNLIKKLRPRFNINLKDDKAFLCVRIDLKQEFPMLQLTRRIKRDRAVYFGPYSSAWSIRQTLSMLNAALGLRVCKDRELYNRSRPCPLYEMDYCSAPCVGHVDRDGYHERVQQAIRFLKGNPKELTGKIEKEMERAAANLDFERAAELRDRLRAIERTLEKQRIRTAGSGDRDVVGIHREKGAANVEVLYVRDGNVAAQSAYHLRHPSDSDADLLSEFVARFYAGDRFVPPEVHVPEEPSEAEGLVDYLRHRRGGAVKLHVPQRGDGRRLVELACTNAGQSFKEHSLKSDAQDAALTEIAEALSLPEPPRRIDCFDIANLQGSHTVAAMSVLVDGLPASTLYRHYKIETVAAGTQDDFRAMNEVVERRYARAVEEGSPPDLIVIDGGRGQLQSAERALQRLDLDLPICAIAKGRGREHGDRIFLPGTPTPAPLRKGSRGLLLLMRARDEAHRFANRYHGHLRNQGRFLTGLEDVPGVGPRTIAKLTRHFPTLQEMREATMEELQHRAGLNAKIAAKVYEALHAE